MNDFFSLRAFVCVVSLCVTILRDANFVPIRYRNKSYDLIRSVHHWFQAAQGGLAIRLFVRISMKIVPNICRTGGLCMPSYIMSLPYESRWSFEPSFVPSSLRSNLPSPSFLAPQWRLGGVRKFAHTKARAKGCSPKPRGHALLEPRCLHVMQNHSGTLDAYERRAERAIPGSGGGGIACVFYNPRKIQSI
jgi:hypothetical protein